MGALVSLFGALMVLALTLSGLLLIVAPPLGRRMLGNTAAGAGLFLVFLFALNAVWEFMRALNPLVLILGLIAASSLAYFVRERRLDRPARRDGLRHAERSPVMPQHVAKEGEE